MPGSTLPTLTSADVFNAVERALTKYSSQQVADYFQAIATFTKVRAGSPPDSLLFARGAREVRRR